MAPDQIIVACCQADARYPEWDLKMLKFQRHPDSDDDGDGAA